MKFIPLAEGTTEKIAVVPGTPYLTRRPSLGFIEDLSSPELIGGEDSLLRYEDVMVIPGHMDDASRPVLLAVTKGSGGKEPRAFAKVRRQVKVRLIEASETIRVVVVLCDCWNSASFEEEHHEELRAFDKNGIRFVFLLVGSPEGISARFPWVSTKRRVRMLFSSWPTSKVWMSN